MTVIFWHNSSLLAPRPSPSSQLSDIANIVRKEAKSRTKKFIVAELDTDNEWENVSLECRTKFANGARASFARSYNRSVGRDATNQYNWRALFETQCHL